jgi:hypothetical protein
MVPGIKYVYKRENGKWKSSLKICLFSFYLSNQIFDMSQQAVSAAMIENSAQEIFPLKKTEGQKSS